MGFLYRLPWIRATSNGQKADGAKKVHGKLCDICVLLFMLENTISLSVGVYSVINARTDGRVECKRASNQGLLITAMSVLYMVAALVWLFANARSKYPLCTAYNQLLSWFLCTSFLCWLVIYQSFYEQQTCFSSVEDDNMSLVTGCLTVIYLLLVFQGLVLRIYRVVTYRRKPDKVSQRSPHVKIGLLMVLEDGFI